MNDIEMDKIINVLNKGEIALLPSDTVYGLFADATNINAIKKIDDAKKSNKPHLILVSSVSMLEKYVCKINELQMKLIEKYWPNTLTILFEKSNLIIDELTKGSEYVAVRMPKNEFLLELINKIGRPLISTSANITNEKVITKVDLIDKKLKSKISYIYDIWEVNSVASTLIKVENNKIIFLRDGILCGNIKNDFSKYLK